MSIDEELFKSLFVINMRAVIQLIGESNFLNILWMCFEKNPTAGIEFYHLLTTSLNDNPDFKLSENFRTYIDNILNGRKAN